MLRPDANRLSASKSPLPFRRYRVNSSTRGIPGKRKTITISRHESWPICLRRTSGKTQATPPRRSEMQDLSQIDMAINQQLTNIMDAERSKAVNYRAKKGLRLSGK